MTMNEIWGRIRFLLVAAEKEESGFYSYNYVWEISENVYEKMCMDMLYKWIKPYNDKPSELMGYPIFITDKNTDVIKLWREIK